MRYACANNVPRRYACANNVPVRYACANNVPGLYACAVFRLSMRVPTMFPGGMLVLSVPVKYACAKCSG